VIGVRNLKRETADVLTTHMMNVLNKYKLPDKIIAFCGDNCNTNFGGVAWTGTNNVFAKLKSSNSEMNIQAVRCAAQILHNALQTSADILPIDVEAIVNKIFQYFHIYTVRVDELNDFCDFVDAEFKHIPVSAKTKWLSLQPAITSYFHFSRIEVIFSSPRKMPNDAKKNV
jgi:hypothetical protein